MRAILSVLLLSGVSAWGNGRNLSLPPGLPGEPVFGPSVPIEPLGSAAALPSLPGLSSVALPALHSAPELDPYEDVVRRVAIRHGEDVRTVRKALSRMEREMETTFKKIGATPKQVEFQLSKPEFVRFIEAVKYADIKSRERRPLLVSHADVIVSLAREYGLAPAEVEAKIKQYGLQAALSSKTAFAIQLRKVLEGEAMRKVASAWPDNVQSRFLKMLMTDMEIKSGKSIEETSREGAFAYVWISRSQVLRATTGRDPDFHGCDASFYVTFVNGGFKISLYPSVAAPKGAKEVFEHWLLQGVPALEIQRPDLSSMPRPSLLVTSLS